MSKPKPIRDDPTQGQLQVVVSFRVDPHGLTPTSLRDDLYLFLGDEGIHDLDIAVREIGADGERSEDEGRYDQPALTEDVPRHHTTRDKTDIKPKDGLL